MPFVAPQPLNTLSMFLLGSRAARRASFRYPMGKDKISGDFAAFFRASASSGRHADDVYIDIGVLAFKGGSPLGKIEVPPVPG